MDWLNIHRTTLGSGQFLGCEPVQRATWLCLLAYCADQENGGRIEGAESWGDRKWQQIARVTYSEVHDDCPLWSWDGADLVVWAYPAEKEAEVRRNRENGGRGGRPRKPEQNHLVISGLTETETETEPPAPISAETEQERNRKGNRKGKEEQQARRAGFSPDQFDHLIPVQLADQPAFVDAWHDWTASRHERRKPISERAAQLQLATLAGLGGVEAAIASIRQSIANDWQGLFAPKDGAAPAVPTHPTIAEWMQEGESVAMSNATRFGTNWPRDLCQAAFYQCASNDWRGVANWREKLRAECLRWVGNENGRLR